MSKQRKTGDLKDNNISSKLLGANLSDINIEKFRDLTQYRKEKYDLATQISAPILRTLTNKFSTEVIFALTLPAQALSNIEPLAECPNIMVLNLAKNNIENLAPLKKLKKLRIVDLSENCITNIDHLHECLELVNLKLQGNMIKGLEQLRAIKTCPYLKNLHLQTLSADQQNPICQLKDYRSNLFSEFPQLKRLDSVPSHIQFSNGTEIKSTAKKDIKLNLQNIGPFYTSKFPSAAPYMAPTFPQEKALKQSISSCKSALQDLQVRMRVLLTM